MKVNAAARFRDLPKAYSELVAILPPRPIHTEQQYEEASEMIFALAGFDLSADQEDYLDALATFYRAYEREHHAFAAAPLSGLGALEYLMEESEMSASDLGRLLGERSLGSKVLRGERQLSKEHIRRLCDRFKVSADLFMD